MTPRNLLLAVLTLLTACSAREGLDEPPRPERLEPASAVAHQATSVVIRGAGFRTLARQRIGRGAGVQVDRAFQARLGGVELESVTWVDEQTLTAVVPGAFEPGLYDLSVVGPLGQPGLLPGAFRVLPPAMTSALTASARQVSVGQTLTLALAAENIGGAALTRVSPSLLTPSGTGGLTFITGPNPPAVDLAPGETRAFIWVARALTAGDLILQGETAGRDAAGAEARSAQSPPVALTVQMPPELNGALAAPAVANLGQRVEIRLSVRNAGQATALGVQPSALGLSGTGAASVLDGPTPARVDLPGESSVDFLWHVLPSATGTLSLEVTASASDANSGQRMVSPPARVGPAQILRPADLRGTVRAPARVNLGQSFTVSLDTSNLGDSAALSVASSWQTSTLLSAGAAPPAVDIPGGGAHSFAWTFRADSLGTASLVAQAAGTDGTDGSRVALSGAPGATVTVERGASLSGTLQVPSAVQQDLPFLVVLTVRNAGDATARDVTPSAISLAGTASAIRLGGPLPASADIPGGGSQLFAWTFQATGAGSLSLSASAGGTDVNDGSTVDTGPATDSTTVIQQEVDLVASDPFGDGTPIAHLVRYANRIYLGPRSSGTGAVRMNPDGSGRESVSFFFRKDATGSNRPRNTVSTYSSLGVIGCSPNTPSCGPDNEDGRGLLFSGTVGGVERMGFGPMRGSADLNYVYLATDTDSSFDIAYVDGATALTSGLLSVSAAAFFQGRLYLGFTASGSVYRPGLFVLKAMPALPGLDARKDTDLEDLNAESMPGFQPLTTVEMIDVLYEFNNCLYAFNASGGMRSTTTAPRGYLTAQTDWGNTTPIGPQMSKIAVMPMKSGGYEPGEKAYPQLAAFHGYLYLARNTYDSSTGVRGAQLWVCDPALTFDPLACEQQDWSFVAGNGSGDALLSQFNNPGNTAIAFLAATANHLYVGYNNASGVVLFRSKEGSLRPSSRSDFEGVAGCSADLYPAGCDGLGGDGFGDPANVRIFSGIATNFGGQDDAYLAVGNGTRPLRVYRVRDN